MTIPIGSLPKIIFVDFMFLFVKVTCRDVLVEINNVVKFIFKLRYHSTSNRFLHTLLILQDITAKQYHIKILLPKLGELFLGTS